MLLKDAFVANKTAPVIRLLNFLHVRVGEIRTDALVAENERARRAAENFATLAAPTTVVLGAIFALSKFTGILWKKFD